jgi:PPM family protein phosphatase
MRITAYADTNVGRHREHNEDSFFAGGTVFAVADGMGGHAAGEVASAAALRPIAALDGQEFDHDKAATEALREAVKTANREVVSEAREDPNKSGMGTTLTAVIVRDGQLHLGHVGDSRAYLLRGTEAMDQLTTDHTLVEQLVQDGRLSRDEIATHPQRSVITRAIGVDNEVDVDTLPPLVLQPGDQLLLCSDGLTGPVSDEDIRTILVEEPDGDVAVQRLIDAANERGGPDNITVVLLRVEGDAGDPAAATVDDDEADDEKPTVSLGPPPRSIPIRTRPEPAGHDWATDMGRYGDRQGVESGTGLDHPRTGRRIVAVITGVVILLGVLAAGGYLLLSRAYFVGASEADTIAIYNGIPQDVAGVPLHRELDDSGVPLSGLPAHQQERIRNGLTFPSRTEAETAVEGYRSEVENAVEVGPQAPEDETPDETPTSAP